MLNAISVATDFRAEGHAAFEHALRLALLHRCRLDVLHVRPPEGDDHWDHFPRVREVLQRWGMLPAGASPADIEAVCGVRVHKVEIRSHDPVDGLATFLISHRPDLLVMASHRREWMTHLLTGSVSARVAHETRVPDLIIGPAAAPLVDPATGEVALKTVLVPVAHEPPPAALMQQLAWLSTGLDLQFDLVHVGTEPPEVLDAAGRPLPVRLLDGPVVDTILAAAEGAQIIAMLTEGPRGLVEAFTGSTAEQIIRRAPCPVLALPPAL